MEKLENKNICAECGGYCCKKCGCDYFVSDIESFKIDALEELLKTGHVSIVAALDFKHLPNGKLTVNHLLYLRERNIGRDVIDLFSLKRTCASLTEQGCPYTLDKRPSGGATLIPKENMECFSSVDRLEEINKWLPYQKVLERLVKRHTGLSVQAKLKEDAEKLFNEIYNQEYEYVAEAERYDIKKNILELIKVFPEEAKKAEANYQKKLIPFKNAQK